MSFPTLNDKTNQVPIRSDLLRWCPNMDLIAFVTDTDELVVNRLAGHRVWLNTPYTPRGAQVTPVALDWRPDGKVLVIAYDNGHLQYLDVNDGSVVEQRLTENISDEHRALKSLRWSEHDRDLAQACSKV